ncbi:hypothetical protein RFI_15189 [Reticulomyxa filosa]|uniref:Uncharacterized protein n=1 Tax=Reticulomyxa filosa TaxID=46433 RepID=X6N7W9_RETFI|nr:hypothetical protein RFI_15189 [Reticulomyxa filosa]|eukprot:ETO22013.1 hypothetical protein RFI_15189 [Reticulomyxa filosa]
MQNEALEGLKELKYLSYGSNVHSIRYPASPSTSYEDDVNQWHCYLVQFLYLSKMWSVYPQGFTVRTTLQFHNFDMESGFDFVRVFVNSKEEQFLTGTFAESPRLDKYFTAKDIEDNSNSIEVCLNVITDESITGKGFESTFRIEYQNPQRVEWHSDFSEPCHTAQPNGRNPSRWDGTCGVGVQRRVISQCYSANISSANLNPAAKLPQVFYGMKEQAIQLEQGYCNKGDVDAKYCIKADCEHANTKKAPEKANHFNGVGRIDPTYPDPFAVILFEYDHKRSAERHPRTGKRHPDNRLFTYSVTDWGNGFEESKLRLGVKMARSLLLGDSFTVAFSGSSNTAGHDNMFLSSYPMQLQSLLRPLWVRIGYKGAAFVVKNHAIGGSLGTSQISSCLPEIVGDDADVVFWEEIMNDGGRPPPKAIENHIRNAITLKRRPVWHAILAGSYSGDPSTFRKVQLNSAYKELAEYYTKVGAGIVEFFPSNGINPLVSQDNKYSPDLLYVTWHPGPRGHRYYAQIIAHFYLTSLLSVLKTIQPAIQNMKTTVPTLEMHDLLQDIPADSILPSGKYCGKVCTSAKRRWCISGMFPSDSSHFLRWYAESTPLLWPWQSIASNAQSLANMDGGQAAIDAKYGFLGNGRSQTLKIKIKTSDKKYVMIHRPYADWNSLKEAIKTMRSWLHLQIDGKDVECIRAGSDQAQDLWMVDDEFNVGCVVALPSSSQDKSILSILISGDITQNIPIWAISTF